MYSPPMTRVTRASALVTPNLRQYEVAELLSDGSVALKSFRAPSFPLLDSAFSAFAQGALIATPNGPIAIEDLSPGDLVNTTSGEPAPVLWIGASTFASNYGNKRTPLVRIMADSFGLTRPSSFVTVGPSARILQTPPHLRHQMNEAPLLTPARAFVDTVNVIEVFPPTPVQLFHICLPRHAAVDVGGISMETFHPGQALLKGATHTQRDFFLTLFSHISQSSDFGPLAHPRAPEHETDAA